MSETETGRNTDRSSPSKPLRLTGAADLDRVLAKHDRVLVEFYTNGCTLCQSIEPVLGNVARAIDVTVAMINPREDLSLVETYDIRSVPTLLLFEKGEPVGRLAEGFEGTAAVVSFVKSHGE